MKLSLLDTADGKDYKIRAIAMTDELSKTKKISHIKPIGNTMLDRKRIVDIIIETIGGAEENQNLYEVFALYYSETAISRAL